MNTWIFYKFYIQTSKLHFTNETALIFGRRERVASIDNQVATYYVLWLSPPPVSQAGLFKLRRVKQAFAAMQVSLSINITGLITKWPSKSQWTGPTTLAPFLKGSVLQRMRAEVSLQRSHLVAEAVGAGGARKLAYKELAYFGLVWRNGEISSHTCTR